MKRPSSTFATLSSGVRLHYRVQGEPSAPWLVMFNGLLSDMTMWSSAIQGLGQRFRILTFDARGQGRSDTPEDGPYTVRVMAQEAWELMDHLGVQNSWLAGLSNGSSMALELLAAHPGAFSGAILTSCMPRYDFTTRLQIHHWIHCLDVGGPVMQFDAAAPYLWGDRFLNQCHSVLRAYHQMVSSGASVSQGQEAFRGVRLQMEGIQDWDIGDGLERITEPVLLLCGAEDLLTPPWKCLETARRIAHNRFELIPGIGHAFPVEDPRSYQEKILAFVDKLNVGFENYG